MLTPITAQYATVILPDQPTASDLGQRDQSRIRR